MIAAALATVRFQAPWPITPAQWMSALGAFLCVLVVWWVRERRMAAQRYAMGELNALAEDVISSPSRVEILRKVNTALPKLWKVTEASVYLIDPASNAFRRISAAGESEPMGKDSGPLASGVALCHSNRTLLAVSDTRRNAFFRESGWRDVPRSVMFVPAFARNEVTAVLVVESTVNAHSFTDEEQSAAQHLANQIGAAFRLLDQQAIREQLYRTEKLAASGELMSGVAEELRRPLALITKAVAALRAEHSAPDREKIETLAAEAQRASGIVERLIAFSRERAGIQSFDLNEVLAGGLRLHSPDLAERHVDVSTRFSAEPLIVTGSRSQLEQALNMFLQYAERSASAAKERRMSVSTARAAARVIIEIGWSSRPELLEPDVFGPAPESGGLRLEVCRNVVRNHGGEVRLLRTSSSQSRFEIEIPASVLEPGETVQEQPEAPVAPVRRLTTLVVEPDAGLRDEFVRLVADQGHRVVPVTSAEEAADIAARVRFDVIFCATHLTSLNWIDLFDRVEQQIACFVLLTDSLNPDPVGAARTTHVPTLGRPVDGRELARIMAAVTARLGPEEE